VFYFVKTPSWLKWYYASCIWQIDTSEKILYLTFDDGPHPAATLFVLEQLKQFDAKATFFCIGKNVVQHTAIFDRILSEGHAVGNHTQNHLNGWKVKDQEYLNNIKEASGWIESSLFRPPYGRITKFQLQQLSKAPYLMDTIMWSVLSADFDTSISPKKCLSNVTLHAKQGSIIVFHDSEKAFDRMSYALPKVLEFFTQRGYRFDKIDEETLIRHKRKLSN
jgi:peptidoglycan/xylan/chitin deacetylase (PgdA/CDA1 family)